MERVLITGAGGFFASRFTEYFKGVYDVIPVDRRTLDVTREDLVINFIKNINPQYVIHTAAVADTKLCEEDPEKTFKINVEGSINVAKACELKKSKLIFFSSEQVYNGNIITGPYNEKIKPYPNTNYGKQKLEAEKRIKEITSKVWILRLSWLFGFPERGGKTNPNIIWNIISSRLNGEKIKVSDNEYRGMTYIYDLLDNFRDILDIPFGTYNTGSENNLSTYDTARIVLRELELLDFEKEIIIKDTEKYKDSPRDLRLSNEKLKRWDIEFNSTEEGIKRCIKEFGYKQR